MGARLTSLVGIAFLAACGGSPGPLYSGPKPLPPVRSLDGGVEPPSATGTGADAGSSTISNADAGVPVDGGIVGGGLTPADGGVADAGVNGSGSADAGVRTGDTLPPPQLPSGYRLAWHDEFDGTTFDTSKWTNMYPGPHRDGFNTARSISVANGFLSIRSFTEQGTHYAAMLSTLGNFEPLYGYFEAKIRFSNQIGNWCAFWLQSPTNGNPIGNSAVAGTEIDVIEHRASDGPEDLTNLMTMNLNWDGYDVYHKDVDHYAAPPPSAPSLQGNWHIYGVLWTATGYTFYLDDVPVWTTSTAISQRTEHLWLTCEVQSSMWSGDIPAGGYGPLSSSTTGMDVDWVRAWQSQ